MNTSINSLLGPLEAATRQGSWEDAEDIAGEIVRLSRLQRLSELEKIQEALKSSRIKQGQSTLIPSGHSSPARPGASGNEPWPFG